MLEKDIEKQILQWLDLNRFFCWKVPRVGTYHKKAGKFLKPNNKYAITGVSDIIAVRGGETYFIEVKVPKGKQSENQKLFQYGIERAGGIYLLARSLDDVMNYFQK